MMKKTLLLMCLFVFLGFSVFGNTEEQEVAFLLFSPDSGDTFADEEQAVLHLDNAAQFLLDKAAYPGQIYVYGFTADFANEINPTNLSTDRAVFVINELQKRGVPQELFAAPEGRGSVRSWDTGGNDISLNRRVIITLIPPEEKIAESKVVIVSADEETESSRRGFPWWLLLLLLLLLAALLFLLSKLKKKPEEKPVVIAVPETVVPPPVAASEIIVCLEEEIRFCAYMLHLENGQNSDMVRNWWQAVGIICPQYEAEGYEVYMEEGCWWARMKR